MTNRRRVRRAHPLALILLLVGATALVAQGRARLGSGVAPPSGGGDAPVAVPRAKIEVAFVLDTTGSMSGLIEGAKQKIWSIASQMSATKQQSELRVALIGYRDRGDQYVTRRFDLTSDVDSIYGHLQAFRADGGGDGPESVNQALHEAVTGLGWSTGADAYRVIFLVGDAPPHMDYQDDVSYVESARLAAQRDIAINTVQCGSVASTTSVWQEIARIGSGQYAAIAQDGAMVAMEAPMDEELAELNRALARTAVAWGDAEEKESLHQKLERSLAAGASAVADRLSYMARRGGRVNTGRKDLVDAVKAGEVDVLELEEEDLPAPMVSMAPAERQAYVESQSKKREEMQARIQALASERDGWVRSELERRRSAGEAGGFDAKVLETVREQAAAKGILYED